MLIVGYVSWEIRIDAANEIKRSEVVVTLFKSGKLSFNPMILSNVFAIASIGIGIEVTLRHSYYYYYLRKWGDRGRSLIDKHF